MNISDGFHWPRFDAHGHKQNGRYRLEWGAIMTNDHATTRKDWARIVDLNTGEPHGGRIDVLLDVFEGRKTIDDLYS
jgi:hypothetical protein